MRRFLRRPALVPAAVCVAYLLAAAYRLPFVRWQVNPDGISYIAVAERYLAGDAAGAVNAYWGPLFSWLLLPFLAFGADPLLASKVLTYATGLVAIPGVWLLSGRFAPLLPVRAAVTAVFAVLALAWASYLLTPDLLIVCILVFYAYAVSGPRPTGRDAAVAGVLGALAYVAKSYGFVFFLAHWTLLGAARWLATRKREEIRRYVIGLAAFLLLALPWVAVISAKYGRPTFGTAGAYNIGLVGPENGPVGSQNHPMHTQGLLAPHDETARSAWEDPTFLTFPAWPSFGESAERIAALLAKNTETLLVVLQDVSPLSLPILLAAVLITCSRLASRAKRRLFVVTIASGALFASGFLLLLVEERYVWILIVLLLVLGAAIVDFFARAVKLRPVAAGLTAAALLASFATGPLSLLPRLQYVNRASADLAEYTRAAGVDLRGRRLASDDQWHATLYLNHHLGARYHGTVLPGTPEEIRRELDAYGIERFIVWGDPAAAAYLDGFTRVPLPPPVPFALYER